jgi:large subunit ribosomal protein L23
MALFSLKKDTEKKKPAPKKKAVVSDTPATTEVKIGEASNSALVLLNPRITEKASMLAERNVYTFDVAPRATSKDITRALKAIYNVVPVKVNIVNVPSKRVSMRSKRTFGTKSGGKKAYVYLKKGETIDTV